MTLLLVINNNPVLENILVILFIIKLLFLWAARWRSE